MIPELTADARQTRKRFLELVADVRPQLHRYCARMAGSLSDGEDIVQETLARAYFSLPEHDEMPLLRPWLFRIAHNCAIDHLRRRDRSRETAVGLDPQVPGTDSKSDTSSPSPEDALAREDALRAMRAARLVSTRGFEIEPATLAALPGVAPLLPKVSAERVRDELTRLILGDAPDRGLDTLREAGLLAIVLPELVSCIGVTQNRYHAHDVYRHTLETLRFAEPRFRVRWAALCHDLGKPATRGEKDDGQGTFYGHPQVGAEITEKLLERLRFPRAERDAIVLLVREHLFDYKPEWTDAAVRRFLKRVGWDHLEDLYDLRRADILGTGVGSDGSSIDQLKVRIEAVRASRAPLSISELAVDGKDVMEVLGVPAGPLVGQVLRSLLEEVLEDPSLNDRERLLERLKSLS